MPRSLRSFLHIHMPIVLLTGTALITAYRTPSSKLWPSNLAYSMSLKYRFKYSKTWLSLCPVSYVTLFAMNCAKYKIPPSSLRGFLQAQASFIYLFIYFFKILITVCQSESIIVLRSTVYQQTALKSWQVRVHVSKLETAPWKWKYVTAHFKDMRTLKFKAQPRNTFFTTVKHIFGGSSQLPSTVNLSTHPPSDTSDLCSTIWLLRARQWSEAGRSRLTFDWPERKTHLPAELLKWFLSIALRVPAAYILRLISAQVSPSTCTS